MLHKLALAALIVLAWPLAALAQGPGPGPVPSPWQYSGLNVYYPNGCVIVGSPSTCTGNLLVLPPLGSAPTSPVNGDFWSTNSGFYGQVNGATVGPFTEGAGGSFAATSPLAVTFPSSVVTYALDYNASLALYGSSPVQIGINLANANTWTGQQTFVAPVLGTPASGTFDQGLVVTQSEPTTSTAGPVALNLIATTLQGTATGSGQDAFGLNNFDNYAFRTNCTIAGGGGGLGCGAFSVAVTAPTTSNYISVLDGTAYANVAVDTGVLEAINGYAFLGPEGSVNDVAGGDFNAGGAAGASITNRWGIYLTGVGAVTGSVSDDALHVTSEGTVGWNNFVNISDSGGTEGINATGSLFIADTATTIANVFNMANVTVTGDILDFPNVVLQGNGTLILGPNAVGSGSLSLTDSGGLLVGGNGSADDVTLTTSAGSPVVLVPHDVIGLEDNGYFFWDGTLAPSGTANGQGWVYASSVNGAIYSGNGSADDVTLANSAGAAALQVPTGTQNVAINGGLVVGSPTGGQIGAGVINATGFDINGTPIGTIADGMADHLTFYPATGTAVGSADNLSYAGSTLTIGTSGSAAGILALVNATSGSIALEAPTGALGSSVATLPVNSGTLAELNLAQTWSGLQTFATSDIAINGGSATAGLATVSSAGVVSSCAACVLTTSLTAPTLYGGSAAASTLGIQATSYGSPSNAALILQGNGQPTFVASDKTFFGTSTDPSGGSFSAMAIFHAGTNEDFNISGHVDLSSGVSFASVDDNNTTLEGVEFLASEVYYLAPIVLFELESGTPSTYACFTAAGQLISSSTAC